MIDDLEKLQIKALALRQLKILESKDSFWCFCRTLAPDFYKPGRKHLKELCNTLQALYEKKLINPETKKPYRKLMLSLPPRHGKSRTLIMFCAWILGQDKNNKIITCSYNDDQATDFSKYTRDLISQDKNIAHEIIYNDIFENTRIKRGSASFQQWALEGSFFNYKGAGVGGSITGKGANVLIVDDPIKSSEDAYNEKTLEKIYKWYTGTFLSRAENDSIEIINMTRWSKKDIIGRIEQTDDLKNWYKFIRPAFNNNTQEMLCNDLLSLEKYNWLKNPQNFDPVIFQANYLQEPADIKGNLYSQFLTYSKRPPKFERIINYTDVKDKGKDYFCSINAGILRGQAYILNVIYTNNALDTNLQDQVAKNLYNDNVNQAYFESNGAGGVIMENIREKQFNIFGTRATKFISFHQNKNKESRLLNNASNVEYNIFYPEDWKNKFPDFYQAITTFKKTFSGQPDDGPDALTGIIEKINEKKTFRPIRF